MGRNAEGYLMKKEKITDNAIEDIRLYNNDFGSFFSQTENHYINNKDELYQCYKGTIIFKNWKEGLTSIENDSLNNIFNEIQEDINLSFHLSAYGLYRTANMHLRSAIELSLQVIYFFDHHIEYELWKDGNFIIKHEKLIAYIKNHPKFKSKGERDNISLIVDKITKSWTLFSKHIHAESLIYFQTEKTSHKSSCFELKDFNIWKGYFIKTTEMLNNLYCSFFKNELIMFPSNIKNILDCK